MANNGDDKTKRLWLREGELKKVSSGRDGSDGVSSDGMVRAGDGGAEGVSCGEEGVARPGCEMVRWKQQRGIAGERVELRGSGAATGRRVWPWVGE
ncbi:hypothetical protein NL676_000444 [Syzygium grande]|nr:hypothetical protein NL676_000444 [Syzygium grande]